VNATNLDLGWDVMWSPITETRLGRTLRISKGKPASSKSLARSSPPAMGVSKDGFRMTVFPRAMAGATALRYK